MLNNRGQMDGKVAGQYPNLGKNSFFQVWLHGIKLYRDCSTSIVNKWPLVTEFSLLCVIVAGNATMPQASTAAAATAAETHHCQTLAGAALVSLLFCA